jgi:hypothetical protein
MNFYDQTMEFTMSCQQAEKLVRNREVTRRGGNRIKSDKIHVLTVILDVDKGKGMA